MGNTRQSEPKNDFQKMVQSMRKDQSRRVSINPQKKYLSLMKEVLSLAKLPQNLKKNILNTLVEKVSQVDLIETVTCINALRNNQFESSVPKSILFPKERPESKFVKVNFGEGFLTKMLGRLKSQPQDCHSIHRKMQKSIPSPSRSGSSQQEEKQKQKQQKIKVITRVMKKQLNRMMHPFGKLNKSFAQFIEGNWRQFAPQGCRQDEYQKSLRRLIGQWCIYLESGCLVPYRKWIMNYTEMEEKKYNSWIRNLLLQQIWFVNSGYLFSMLITVVNRCKTPLSIDFKELQQSAALLTPSLFGIDPKLQIEGHFFDSIYQMSEIVNKFRPEKILSQLQSVKKRVCTDIDNYHRLVEVQEVYQIDSDNILGIVSYILCKIASKIDQIHNHLIFLRIVYTDKVYYSMGLGSYVYSTIFGSLQFLESSHFKDLLKEKKIQQPLKNKNGGIHSETKEGTSIREDVSQQDISSHSLVDNPNNISNF